MKEKLKSSSKTLYGVCTCIIFLMIVCYFGNKNLKGTYSSSSSCGSNTWGYVTGACPSNYYQGDDGCYYCGKKPSGCGSNTWGYVTGACPSNYYQGDDGCYYCGKKPSGCGSNTWGYVTGACPNDYYQDSNGCYYCNTKKCYICLGSSGSVESGGTYKSASSNPGANCHVTSNSSCSGTPSPKKYICTLTDNSKVCVTAYDSAWAGASLGETGTACIFDEDNKCNGGGTTTPDTPDNPDKPDNPTNPSSTPSTPSNPSNVEDNPKTGSVAIFIVWIIALGTLVYAGVYFKQARENN